jgi:hypothetical protein
MTTKLLFALLSTVFLFAIALVASRPTLALAAPVAAEPGPEIGSCRFFCGNDPTPFKTQAACDAVCSTACEGVC